MNMTRREALIKMAVAMGATVVGPRLLAGAFSSGAPTNYTADDLALLDEIGDTIIPATHIPGAKAVNIGAFIAMMVNDCYPAKAQEAFRAGVAGLARDYETRFGTNFVGGKAEN